MDSRLWEQFPRREPSGAYASIPDLQQSAGNKVLHELIKEGIPSVAQSIIPDGGHPLEPILRAKMESRFGWDFSQVRVHADTSASSSAEAMAAKAYTIGSHIVLGKDQYAPGTERGDRLIGHELTHVVQQSQPHAIGSAADAEAEAKKAATAAVAGQPVHVQTGSNGIQCDADEDSRRIRRSRMDSLSERIARIDAELNSPNAGLLRSEYVDELLIERARLGYMLAAHQPPTPERAEAILNPGGIQRRKQQNYENFVNLPKGLQEDMQKWGVVPPKKPPVFSLGGMLPSPKLQAEVERVARKADEEKISIGAAVRKVQQEQERPRPPKAWPTDPVKWRHEMDRQMMAIGGKPVQDPNRKPTDWEKAEIEGTEGGKRNFRNWRTIYNPDSGDIVGYERESDGYYERRNTKGELTHAREKPMREDETFLTHPDRELTPFERQHVFIIEKKGRSNPEAYRPIYNKSTGQLVGYTQRNSGITRTYNAEGVITDVFELGLEPSPIQADDLLGVAAVGKAVGKKVIGKVGQWAASKVGEEVVEQGGKRLLTSAGREALEEIGEFEFKQVGRESVEELSEVGLKGVADTGGQETAELVGKEIVETSPKQVPAPFNPAPADVGDSAFLARMNRDVENVMRANIRNTIGSGGEAAAQANARTTAMDLNAIKTNFPQLDTVSRETVASVKAFGVDKPLNASVVARYDKELQALRTVVEPGVPTKLGKAADLMATNRQAIQAAGAWPSGLARNATPEQIAKFINQRGVLAIPADHVATVRAAVAANARANPAAYGLTPGVGLGKGIERLTARVQSLGLTADEIMNINKRVWGNP